MKFELCTGWKSFLVEIPKQLELLGSNKSVWFHQQSTLSDDIISISFSAIPSLNVLNIAKYLLNHHANSKLNLYFSQFITIPSCQTHFKIPRRQLGGRAACESSADFGRISTSSMSVGTDVIGFQYLSIVDAPFTPKFHLHSFLIMTSLASYFRGSECILLPPRFALRYNRKDSIYEANKLCDLLLLSAPPMRSAR